MHRVHFIEQRMRWGMAIMGAYGLWVVYARLPWDVDWSDWAFAATWSVAIFAAVGALLFATGAALAQALAARSTWLASPRSRGLVETLVLLPVAIWWLMNEIVFSTTHEVLGVHTLRMVWHHPAETWEASWEMGAMYLVSAAITIVLLAAGFFAITTRSWKRHRRNARAAKEGSPIESFPRRRMIVTRSVTVFPFVIALALVLRIQLQPSAALTTVLRSAPPLRALNAANAMAGNTLPRPADTSWAMNTGTKRITPAEYEQQMGEPRNPAPNVILILLESVPAKALRCYGHPYEDVTPHLDRLAAGGTLFEHAWAGGPFSAYGVASIMTSLYMLRGDSYDYFKSIDFPHLGMPHALHLAGYELALFSSGNESFDNLSAMYPRDLFNVFFSREDFTVPKDDPLQDCMRMDDRYAFAEFEKWMSSREENRPFYCGFYLQSPHFNYEVPAPWDAHYQPTPPYYSSGDAIIRIPDDVLPKLKNQYANAMRYTDHWIGRIVERLDASGDLANSIIVVTGDHGEAFMEHGLARHGVDIWEEMIHVPLIVYVGEDLKKRLSFDPPSRVPDTVSHIDIAPTVAALVGIKPHPSWQGTNVLDPDYAAATRPVFSLLQLTRWQEAVCLDKIKYVHDFTEAEERLFDLAADPGETRNLAATYPELLHHMRNLLATWHYHQLDYYSNKYHNEYIAPLPECPGPIRGHLAGNPDAEVLK